MFVSFRPLNESSGCLIVIAICDFVLQPMETLLNLNALLNLSFFALFFFLGLKSSITLPQFDSRCVKGNRMIHRSLKGKRIHGEAGFFI